MASAEHVAHAFWSALRRHDVHRAGALLAADTQLQLAGLPPARGDVALARYLAAGADVPGSLRTVALYGDMVIAERIASLPGEVESEPHLILTVARVEGDRLTSWEDFVDPVPAHEAGLCAA